MLRLPLLACLFGVALPAEIGAKEAHLQITVTAGKHDYKNTPIAVPLSLPKDLASAPYATLEASGSIRWLACGQLTAPSILSENVKPSAEGLFRRDLNFIFPDLKAGQSMTLGITITPDIPAVAGQGDHYRWIDVPHQFAELLYGDRPVMRYMDIPYDPNPKKRVLNYKVFHHLYDPDGKFFVTNGGETDFPDQPKKKLLYPHHRGLMYAFNKCTYDGQTVDTWHAKPGDTHQEHVKFLNVEAGPVLGRHRVLVDWHGKNNEVFAKEERELTMYNVPGGTLVEFASRLRPTDGPVKLGGDPQHAGFHFRARNDVADKTAKQTYFLRPDGKGELDETRNWDPKTKNGPVNLPWNAMSFALDGKRYTVAYLDKPTNPRESRWSERDYGRFGNYFEYAMTKDRPLLVDYRIWLQEGEMTGRQVQELSTEFVTPPAVSVK
jgi:Methane oxygenase PmoA